jgi:hypothetical protein
MIWSSADPAIACRSQSRQAPASSCVPNKDVWSERCAAANKAEVPGQGRRVPPRVVGVLGPPHTGCRRKVYCRSSSSLATCRDDPSCRQPSRRWSSDSSNSGLRLRARPSCQTRPNLYRLGLPEHMGTRRGSAPCLSQQDGPRGRSVRSRCVCLLQSISSSSALDGYAGDTGISDCASEWPQTGPT